MNTVSYSSKQLFVIALLLSASLMRCSGGGGQGDQAEEPVNGADSLDNASLNNNSQGQQQGQQGQQGQQAEEGAAMNNAPEENFAGANNGAPINNALDAESSGNILTNNISGNPLTNPISNPAAVPLNQSMPMNASVSPDGGMLTGNAAPTNSAGIAAKDGAAGSAGEATPANWDRMNSSPFNNPQSNWGAKGKVKYITRKTTKHAKPDGPVVGGFEVGNHPLVYQDGNWVELSNGTFIRGNSATDSPVGYPRKSLSH